MFYSWWGVGAVCPADTAHILDYVSDPGPILFFSSSVNNVSGFGNIDISVCSYYFSHNFSYVHTLTYNEK